MKGELYKTEENTIIELLNAEITIDASINVSESEIDVALSRVNEKLQRYTNYADKADYAFAIASGIMAGILDSVFVGETIITGNDIALSHEQVNNFIQEYAKNRGFDRSRLKDAIGDLEKAFKVAQDNVWKGAGIGVSAKNHHLADLAHHPTPIGLLSAVVVQFLRVGTFINKEGELHFVMVETTKEDLLRSLVPAVITGVLNWLVVIAENKYEETTEKEIPAPIKKLIHLVASTPMIIEIAKCADNWFGHLVSDMGGSKNTAGGGMGIPGILISLLYEVAALPVLKDTGLPALVDDLYQKQKIDLRHELSAYKALGKQAVPVIFNEIFVRIGFFVSHLATEIANNGARGVHWKQVIPIGNRTVERMITISSMTFTMADTTDAAVRATVESGGNWVLYAGKFASRFNYVGAGRAAVAIVKEVSNESKEAQLIHEKMLLTQAKSISMVNELQAYKSQLEERLSEYLVEDIETFMNGVDFINQGMITGDSDLIIKGNIVIQKKLGRESQFADQDEFDDFMDSDLALQF